MDIYLPIAEMSVNAIVILGIGGLVGFLSGLFGVGGGFLLTPLLIFIGIPPAVAVASGANQMVASSISGVLGHWRRGNVDIKMGLVMLAGGLVGASIGVWLFALLRGLGQIDLVIKLAFLAFLGVIGILMLIESLRALLHRRVPARPLRARRKWIDRLPLKTRFRRSRLYISALLPGGLGLLVGSMVAILGAGGGFIMVPAMIYILGMPTSVVIGTSLFQIFWVTIHVTLLHALTTRTVDLLLALLLLLGGVVGAQIGVRAGAHLRGDQLRALLAILVLAVAGRLGYELIATPADLYGLGEVLRK
jgi:uncharacterized membrane protein YfcA